MAKWPLREPKSCRVPHTRRSPAFQPSTTLPNERSSPPRPRDPSVYFKPVPASCPVNALRTCSTPSKRRRRRRKYAFLRVRPGWRLPACPNWRPAHAIPRRCRLSAATVRLARAKPPVMNNPAGANLRNPNAYVPPPHHTTRRADAVSHPRHQALRFNDKASPVYARITSDPASTAARRRFLAKPAALRPPERRHSAPLYIPKQRGVRQPVSAGKTVECARLSASHR